MATLTVDSGNVGKPNGNSTFDRFAAKLTGENYFTGNSPYLGTPMRDTLILNVPAHFDIDGTEIPDSIIDLFAVEFTVTRESNVVVTPVGGVNGTIKEYINKGDYILNCRAVISTPTKPSGNQLGAIIDAATVVDGVYNQGRVFSEVNNTLNSANNIVTRNLISSGIQGAESAWINQAEVKKLKQISDAAITVDIASNLINGVFDIFKVAVVDVDWDFNKGTTDTNVRFTLRSDKNTFTSFEQFVVR